MQRLGQQLEQQQVLQKAVAAVAALLDDLFSVLFRVGGWGGKNVLRVPFFWLRGKSFHCVFAFVGGLVAQQIQTSPRGCGVIPLLYNYLLDLAILFGLLG